MRAHLVWKSIYGENSIQTDDSHMEKWNNFMDQSGKALEATVAEHILFFVKVNSWRIVFVLMYVQPIWHIQVSINK